MKTTRRPRRSAAQWQSLVLQQVTSGLSASAFCDRHDLSYASFLQWRRRLREYELPATAGSAVVSEPALPVESIPFIELTAPQALADGSQHWLIELDLGAGIQLRIAQPR